MSWHTRDGDTAVALPPRRSLPPHIEIPKIAILGTSWYERSAGYWMRRVWMTLLWVIATLIYGGVLWDLFHAIRHRHPLFWSLFAVEALVTVGTWALFAVVAYRRRGKPPVPRRYATRRQMFFGSITGGLIAVFLAPVAVCATFGLVTYLLVDSLRPRTTQERQQLSEFVESLRGWERLGDDHPEDASMQAYVRWLDTYIDEIDRELRARGYEPPG